MSEDMVERVARAICGASGYDPDGRDEETLPGNESIDGWLNWFGFKPEARAAIAAYEAALAEQLSPEELARFREASERFPFSEAALDIVKSGNALFSALSPTKE